MHNNIILIHLYLVFLIVQLFDVSTGQGLVQIKLGKTFLTVEEKENKLMEPKFMEVIHIMGWSHRPRMGREGLSSFIGEQICMLKIAHFRT